MRFCSESKARSVSDHLLVRQLVRADSLSVTKLGLQSLVGNFERPVASHLTLQTYTIGQFWSNTVISRHKKYDFRVLTVDGLIGTYNGSKGRKTCDCKLLKHSKFYFYNKF